MDKREYLFQRRNRCVGRILGELEGILDEQSMKLVRRVIKTRIAEYHEDVLDSIDENDGTVFNAMAFGLRDRLG